MITDSKHPFNVFSQFMFTCLYNENLLIALIPVPCRALEAKVIFTESHNS